MRDSAVRDRKEDGESRGLKMYIRKTQRSGKEGKEMDKRR